MALQQKKLFSHIADVSSPSHLIVDVKLSRDDYQLALLLSESCAKIMLPQENRAEDYDLFPVGTGPYRVIQNDNKRLVLQAFDGYFGFRPLLDRIEVWVIDDLHSSMIFPSLSKPLEP